MKVLPYRLRKERIDREEIKREMGKLIAPRLRSGQASSARYIAILTDYYAGITAKETAGRLKVTDRQVYKLRKTAINKLKKLDR